MADDRTALPELADAPRFTPELVEDLPEAARRHLTHALAVGVPLWTSVELTMHGEIKLGSWRRFEATETLVPPHGFVWAATTRLAGLPISGYDRYEHGAGRMRWRLAGLLPVISASGVDVTRSAAGRLAGEAVTLLPTAFREARWTSGRDVDTCVATWNVDGQTEQVQLRVDPDGRLRQVSMQRWGNPHGRSYGRHPFVVTIDDEQTFDGVTIPSRFRAAWPLTPCPSDEDGEFFRARITAMRLSGFAGTSATDPG